MIISGKELSAQLKEEMRQQVATFPEKYGRVPHLVVILVGEDPGSVSYYRPAPRAQQPRMIAAARCNMRCTS